MLKEKKVVEYIDAVDSENLPGGGSVAALVGTLGVSLSRMLAHLSINKKKFKEASVEKQELFYSYANDLKAYKDALIDGIDSDSIAYSCVVEAYKSNDDEMIESALKAAAFIALDIQRNAFNALRVLPNLIELGNKNVMNDLLAGAILLTSCIEISSLNVKVNANLLKDDEIKNNFIEESEKIVIDAKRYRKNLLTKVNN